MGWLEQWRQGDVASVRNSRVLRPIVGTTANWLHALGTVLLAYLPPVIPLPSRRRMGIEGVVVVSQTCDVVQSPSARPYVTIGALAGLSGPTASAAAAGHIPRYVRVPALPAGYFVDLDRLASVSKDLLRRWPRTEGCQTDDDAREFSRGVGRYFSRFAFPDDLNPAVKPLVQRLKEKRGRKSAEGRAVDALVDVRVIADPGWEASSIRATIVFVLPPAGHASDPYTDEEWEEQVAGWMSRSQPHGVIADLEGLAIRVDEWTVSEYLASDPLDLDYLSPA